VSQTEGRPTRRRFAEWTFWFLFWVATIFGIGVAINYSETFTDCIHNRKNRKEYQALTESVSVLGSAIVKERARLRLIYVCVGNFTDKNNGAIVALATVALSAFTFILWRATSQLWRTSQEHARHVERSIELSKEALVTTQRAFVFLNELDPDYSFRTNPEYSVKRLIIKPQWRNSGKTPLRSMTVNVNWIDRSDDLPCDFDYTYMSPPVRMFIGPEATEWSAPIDIPENIASAAIDGTIKIFIWGRVDYGDIFDETQPHFTEWCYRLHPLIGVNDIQIQFVAYGHYNRSDEGERHRT
jgi:hypothetical protein